jgi:hypothetical protein
MNLLEVFCVLVVPIMGYDLHSIVSLSASSTWTLMTGSSTSPIPARNFGTLLFSSSTSSPGTVRGACSAVDPVNQVLYTFGGCWNGNCGETYTDIANNNYAGALWMLNYTTQVWTWVGGASSNAGDSCCTTMVQGNYFSASAQFPGPRVYCQMAVNSGTVYIYGGFGRGQFESGGSPGVAGDLWAYYMAKSTATDFSNSQVRLMPSSIFESSGTDYNLTYTALGGFTGTKAPFRLGGALHYVTYNGQPHLFLHGGHIVTSSGQFDYMYADTWLYRLSDYKWAWVAGMSTNTTTTCPSSTLPSPQSTGSPYPRSNFASCVSADGTSIYMFGGITRMCSGSTISCNHCNFFCSQFLTIMSLVLADLWKFDLSTLTWTFLSGSTSGGTWSYGALNVETSSNFPPPRKGACCWVDTSGNFFLFGGLSSTNDAGKFVFKRMLPFVERLLADSSVSISLNDLWVYRTSSSSWTWIQGSSTGGSSSPTTYPMSRMPTAVRWLGPNTVLLFGGHRTGINAVSPDYEDTWQFKYTLSNTILNCTDGYYFSTGSTNTCLACPLGSFKYDASTSCSACTIGRYAPATGSSTCDVCPAGYLSTTQGASSCSPCSSGTTSAANGSVCVSCSPGTFASSAGSPTCNPCSVGFYATLSGAQGCTQCSTGSFINTTGSSSLCTGCSVGLFASKTASTVCSLCALGSYTSSTLQSTCSLCATGLFAGNNGSSSCSECLPGFYSVASQSFCRDCQPGFYSASNAAGVCTPCPTGKFSSISQMTACQNCSTGTYTSSTGLSTCAPCIAGRVSGLDGSSTCTSCTMGKYAPSIALTICTNCTAGLYTSTLGNSVCSSCSLGTFMPYFGATACPSCPSGFFTNNTGSSSCLACAFGTYSTKSGLSYCSLCSAGSFGAYIGNTTCETCPYPQVTRTEAQSTCSDCGLGESYSNPASCSKCQVGFYANQTALTSCFACFESTTRRTGSVSSDDCSICNQGFYGQPPSPCKRCAQIAAISCPAGSVYPSIDEGFFRAGTDGDDVNVALSCFPSQACLRSGEVLNTPCATGYTGYLCGSCAEKFYRLDLSCKACPSDAVKWFTIILFVVVLLAIIGRVTIQKNQMPPDVRVTLQATQMISLFPSISNKWPKEVLVIMKIYSATVRSSFKVFFS